jgi:N-sulfoglucosamine sulfohydrolase
MRSTLLLPVLSCFALTCFAATATAQDDRRWNVLWVTVDDMSYESAGVGGCRLEGATPRIDALAAQGMRFESAHVNVAICQPTRAVWMTGRYSFRNGATGFLPIRPEVPTLVERVHEAGWLTALFAKTPHVVPSRHAAFDRIVEAAELGVGRDPAAFGRALRSVIERAAAEGRPFFVMANSQDPHRPFAGSEQERRQKERERRNQGRTRFPDAEVGFAPDEVAVPGYLPDLPEIRLELAEYHTSVARADATLGALLDVLDEAGVADRTIVTFVSDHGMPLPFSKTNCYWQSTHVPWIWRWPGVTEAGAVDARSFVSGIDLAPTLLDALGLEPLDGADGRSFVPLLRGDAAAAPEAVFTQIDEIAGRQAYPMRAVHDARVSYVWNAWADGERVFRNESQSGRTFAAMKAAAREDPAIAARVALFELRRAEELYDRAADPHSLRDLSEDAEHAGLLDSAREDLLRRMEEHGDPLLERYRAFLAGRR